MLLGALGGLVAVSCPALAQSAPDPLALRRDPRMTGPVPIPSAERDIPTAVAEKWADVIDTDTALEGALFDTEGNLLVCDVGGSRIVRLDANRRISVLLHQPGLHAGGLAIHPDGRIFVAAAGDRKRGMLGVIEPGRHEVNKIAVTADAYVPNDLVLDRHGGFYFTDFKGTAFDPTGGVYYVAPDMRTVTPIVQRLALANGIALSPDGKYLWVTEFGQNRLLRITLETPATVSSLGVAVVYRFIGPAPDSMRADVEGNLYVALNGQGRVLVFSPGGIPIGQILLPGRDTGHYLKSASLALKPGTNEVYIVASDGAGGQGGAVFRARTFVTAQALPKPQQAGKRS
ncbi:SMP-30/gluconolactonase/LRE family protein [Massilia aurea]|uniref:SMP-30/gluconolactonase/LRE family protein n=1 Tax=Massilia aurea TaxID=373040 RepID=UPI002163947A|nr:SMP-30/gluconolactonase/LRE family protein [Massilia aurea]MCS0708224.1 SMP-30/gluconolactonase/LRE family protein [Massilia aurea]